MSYGNGDSNSLADAAISMPASAYRHDYLSCGYKRQQATPKWVSRETYGKGFFAVPVVSLQRFSADTFDAIIYFSPVTDGTIVPFGIPSGGITLCDGKVKYPVVPKAAGTSHYDCCDCFEPSTVTGVLLPGNYAEAKGIRCCGTELLFKGTAATLPHFAGYSDPTGGIQGIPGISIQQGLNSISASGAEPDSLQFYLPPLAEPTFIDVCMYLSRQHGFRCNLKKMLAAQVHCITNLFTFAGTLYNYDPINFIKDNCWEHGLIFKQDHEIVLEPAVLGSDKSQIMTNATTNAVLVAQYRSEVDGTIASVNTPTTDTIQNPLANWILDFKTTQNPINALKISGLAEQHKKSYYRAVVRSRVARDTRTVILALTEVLGLGQYAGAYSTRFELIIATDSFQIAFNSNVAVGTHNYSDFGVVPGDVMRDATNKIYKVTGVSGNQITLDQNPQNSGMRILDNTVAGTCYSDNGTVGYNVNDGVFTSSSLQFGDEFVITTTPIYCGIDLVSNTENSFDENMIALTEIYEKFN